MKNTRFFLLLTLISACKAKESSFNSIGLFYNSTEKRPYELQLLPDNRFNLAIGSQPHSTSECSGEWKRESDRLIILTCDEDPGASPLVSYYMSKRVWKVELLRKNRIRIDDVVLKRK